MSSITKTDYPTLFTYAILAQSGITANGIVITLNNVYNYGTPSGSGINGTYVNGILDTVDAPDANSDLGNLVTAINAFPDGPSYISGAQTFNAGIKYFSSAVITPDAALTFDAAGDSNAQFFIVTSANTISFKNGVSFNLINGAQASNIFWLANSPGLISVEGIVGTIQGNLLSSSAVTIGGAATINGSIFAQTANVTFAANTTINGTIVCYLKGTQILTENGYKLIEDLKSGDKVVTKGKIHQNESLNEEHISSEPIFWIGNFQAHNLNEETLPICIKANALGENTPFEDLYVSPGHRIIIDGTMVCARDLVNGTTIFQDNDRISVEYYHLELKDHSAIIANGVLSESYLDFNTRNIFENNDIFIESPLLESIVA